MVINIVDLIEINDTQKSIENNSIIDIFNTGIYVKTTKQRASQGKFV